MWVHYDVSNWFLTLNNFYRFNSGHHYLPTYEILMISETMLNFCGIVVAIL
jgi:hypothetical protein